MNIGNIITFLIHFGITRYEARRLTAVAVNRGNTF